MDIIQAVGKNIRKLRIERGMSQEELAHRANMDRPYLSQIELGKRNPTLLMLQEIASALGTHPRDLLK